jgi:hypothetical protein
VSSFIPYDDARTLLKAANLVPPENLHFANEPFQEPQDSNWLSIEAYSNEVSMIDLGANHFAEYGTIVVFCCGANGTGTDSLRTLAKAVCNVFRGLPARNPYYENASIGTGGMADPDAQGNYYVIPVGISFVYED